MTYLYIYIYILQQLGKNKSVTQVAFGQVSQRLGPIPVYPERNSIAKVHALPLQSPNKGWIHNSLAVPILFQLLGCTPLDPNEKGYNKLDQEQAIQN